MLISIYIYCAYRNRYTHMVAKLFGIGSLIEIEQHFADIGQTIAIAS